MSAIIRQNFKLLPTCGRNWGMFQWERVDLWRLFMPGRKITILGQIHETFKAFSLISLLPMEKQSSCYLIRVESGDFLKSGQISMLNFKSLFFRSTKIRIRQILARTFRISSLTVCDQWSVFQIDWYRIGIEICEIDAKLRRAKQSFASLSLHSHRRRILMTDSSFGGNFSIKWAPCRWVFFPKKKCFS